MDVFLNTKKPKCTFLRLEEVIEFTDCNSVVSLILYPLRSCKSESFLLLFAKKRHLESRTNSGPNLIKLLGAYLGA